MKNTIAIAASMVMSTVLLGGVLVSAQEIMFSSQEVSQIVSAVKSENYTLLDTGARAKVSTELFASWLKISAVRKEARDQIKEVRDGVKKEIDINRAELTGKKMELKDMREQNREKMRKMREQMGTGSDMTGKKMELKDMREQNRAQMTGKREEIKDIRKENKDLWSGAKTEIKQIKKNKKEEVKKIKEEDKAQRMAVEKAISENNYEAFKLAASPDMLEKVNSAEKFAMLVELYKANRKGPKQEGSEGEDRPLPPTSNTGSVMSGGTLPIV